MKIYTMYPIGTWISSKVGGAKVVLVSELRDLLEKKMPPEKPPKVTLELTARDTLYYKQGFNRLREELLADLQGLKELAPTAEMQEEKLPIGGALSRGSTKASSPPVEPAPKEKVTK